MPEKANPNNNVYLDENMNIYIHKIFLKIYIYVLYSKEYRGRPRKELTPYTSQSLRSDTHS